jgi:predicted nucleic acid-binding protein
MSDQVRHIGAYTFSADDRLLLDTNVWLSIYGPDPTRRRSSAIYQNAFRKMKEAKSQLHLDVLVLSEFVNACARLEYDQRRLSGLSCSFKEFRDSQDFGPIAQEIGINATWICRAVRRCATGFDTCDVGSLLVHYAQGRSDFNDLMLANLCMTGDLTLVTDDADFKGSGHRIPTANRRLLR